MQSLRSCKFLQHIMQEAEIITEGKARIGKKHSVFYNKVQEFNRDLSVLAVNTFLKKELWNTAKKSFVKDKITILDALSASGLRSIRYSLECRECLLPMEIVANDISTDAINLIKENITLNGVDNVTVSHDDASLAMHKKRAINERFTIIDLDPFGSPAPFLDAAVQSIVDGGLLMVTSTDMAVLCGNHGEACYAKYGCYPVKAKFCHEMALRILIASVDSHANRYGRYVVPLLSLSIDYYVRVFFQVFTSRSEAKKGASKLSYIYICKGCESFQMQPMTQNKNADCLVPANVHYDRRCTLCDSNLVIGGPIWSKPIYDLGFVDQLQTELDLQVEDNCNAYGTFRRMQGMLQMVKEELLDSPLYYQLDRLCCLANCRMPSIKLVRSAFINAGYSISYSHALKNTIKTNAPNEFIWKVVTELFNSSKATLKEDSPVTKILKKNFEYEVSFELSDKEVPLSKSKHLLRYQLNPEENWGPKAKSDTKVDKRQLNQGKRSMKSEEDIVSNKALKSHNATK